MARLRILIGLIVTLMLVGCAETASETTDSSAGAATTLAPKTAVSDLQKASDAKDAVDARLGNALGRVGPTITAPQSQAFAKAFNELPDVAAAQAAYQTHARILADSLDAVAADPAQIKSYGAKNLVAAYAILAKTPAADSAFRFAMNALAKKVALDGIADGDVVEQVLGPSLAPSFLARLLQTGNVADATSETLVVLNNGTAIGLTIAGWLHDYSAFHKVDVMDDLVGVSSTSTLASVRAIAGIIAIWTVGDDLYKGDPAQALTDFLNSGGNAVAGLAAATSLFRSIVVGVDSTPLADAVIKWSGKIATGVGVVMSAIALWNDAGKWNDSADAKVRVAADVLALAASILCLVATGPVGPILATVSLGLTFFADWLENRRIAAQELADIKACFPAIGLDATLTQSIILADPSLVNTLSHDVGLAADQIQWILSVDPNALNSETAMGISFVGLEIAAKVFHLDAPKTGAMLKAAVGDETDPAVAAYKLDTFFRALDFGPGWNGDQSSADALTWLANEENDPMVSADQAAAHRAAFTGAHDYIAGPSH